MIDSDFPGTCRFICDLWGCVEGEYVGDGERLKQKLMRNPKVKACCRRPGSLVKAADQPPGAVLLICSVCGCKHRMMKAMPGMYGAQIHQLGKR